MSVGMYRMQSQLTGSGFSENHAEDGDICFYNIGPRERQKRVRFGQIMLAIGVVLGVALILLDAALGWRLALAGVFMTAGTGFFQAREKT